MYKDHVPTHYLVEASKCHSGEGNHCYRDMVYYYFVSMKYKFVAPNNRSYIHTFQKVTYKTKISIMEFPISTI